MAKTPDPLASLFAEVTRTPPAGYSRGDWIVAVELLLDQHRARILERIRANLQPWPMARRTEPPAEPRYQDAVAWVELVDVLERERRRERSI